MLYKAITTEAKGEPCNCRWVDRCRIPVHWIWQFLTSTSGNLVRRFTLDAYLRRGTVVRITTDASPWGIGGVLEEDNVIVSWFSSGVSKTDRGIMRLGETPSSKDQQVLEAFSVLVALREWAPRWASGRVVLGVQSDNIGALTMLCKMQPHSDDLGLIARELAYDISHASYTPDVASHVAGIANIAADVLSRLMEPGKCYKRPEYLSDNLQHHCAVRQAAWWKTTPALP